MKKGQLTNWTTWEKHLKKFGKKFFWKKERQAELFDVKKTLSELNNSEEE